MKRHLLVVLLIVIFCEVFGSSQSSLFKYESLFPEKDFLTIYYYNMLYESTGNKHDIITSTVIDVSLQENINPIIMLALLDTENIKHNPKAKTFNYKKNKKGKKYIASIDEGLFQQNSRFLSYFIWKFWKENHKFNKSSSEDSTRLAISIVKALLNQFNGDLSKAVMAYNAGANSILNNSIPKSTIRYMNTFFNYKNKMEGK